MIYIAPPDPPKQPFSEHPIIDPEDGAECRSEDGWTDETDDDSIISELMHDFEDEFDEESDEDSTDSEDYEDEDLDEAEDLKRNLAILRTNRQIHSEASSLFYSEALLALEPGDIFCLAKNPFDLQFGYPNDMAWKHNPLKGIGRKNKAGVVRYDSPQLQGDVEPHIVAKFQKIFFDADFGEEHTAGIELWIDDDTHEIREDDATCAKRLIQSSLIFKHLTKILSNSPRITHLEISLEVEVMAASNLIIAVEDFDEHEDMDEDEATETEMKADRIMEIANFKAREIFIDSKVMKPLLKLSNVASFTFKFGFEWLEEEEAYKPPARYVKLLKTMRDRIESNFKEPMNGV